MNKNVDIKRSDDPWNIFSVSNTISPIFPRAILLSSRFSLRSKFSPRFSFSKERDDERLKTGERPFTLCASAEWEEAVAILIAGLQETGLRPAGLGFVSRSGAQPVMVSSHPGARKLAGQPRNRFLDSREDARGYILYMPARADRSLYAPVGQVHASLSLSRDYTCPYKRDYARTTVPQQPRTSPVRK